MKLRGNVQDVHSVGPIDRDAMFRLMEQNYGNMRRDRFDADLDAKRWVIIVRRQADDCPVGFSTQVLLQARVEGRRVQALYSGDTVVDRGHWGDPALGHAWGNFALDLIDRHPPECGPLFWFLTSKGFRTYHYLPLFFRSYFPRPAAATPAWEQAVTDAFGEIVGGIRYDWSRKIICAARGGDFVRSEVAELNAKRRTDPRVRFFVQRNPGYQEGDELCCLAPLTRENFTPAAYRVIGSRSEPLGAV